MRPIGDDTSDVIDIDLGQVTLIIELKKLQEGRIKILRDYGNNAHEVIRRIRQVDNEQRKLIIIFMKELIQYCKNNSVLIPQEKGVFKFLLNHTLYPKNKVLVKLFTPLSVEAQYLRTFNKLKTYTYSVSMVNL